MDLQSKKLKLFLLFIFFVLSIASEYFYREPLFNYSLNFEKKLRNFLPDKMHVFLNLITKLGSRRKLIPLVTLISPLVSFVKIFSMLVSIFFSVYLVNLLKVIYSSPRPFWIDTSLKQKCDYSFGNPSGHACLSACFFLTLWTIATNNKFCKTNNYGKILKYFFLIFILLLIFTIMISRLDLAVHGINQVLYGFTLGLGGYLLFFQILKIDEIPPEKFLSLLDSLKVYFYPLFTVLVALSVSVYFLINYERTKTYKKTLEELCPGEIEINSFNDDGLFDCLEIFGFIGVYSGLLLLRIQISKYYPEQQKTVISWEKISKVRLLIRYLIFLILFILLCFVQYIDTKKPIKKGILFLRIAAVDFLMGTLLFSLGIFSGFALTNKMLGEENDPSEILENKDLNYIEIGRLDEMINNI